MSSRKKLTVLFALLLALAACSRSRVVLVRLINTSAQPLSNIAVDYPEASFGKSALAPGASYEYRIKATDTGPLKIAFTNDDGKSESYSLATLRKNDEGSIEIKLTQESAAANIHLVR